MRYSTLSFLAGCAFLPLGVSGCSTTLGGHTCLGVLYGPSTARDGNTTGVYCCDGLFIGDCNNNFSDDIHSCPDDGGQGTPLDSSEAGGLITFNAATGRSGTSAAAVFFGMAVAVWALV